MKLAFNLNRFLLRGTQVAVYDYADSWEKVLGNEAYVCGFSDQETDSLPKFTERFGDRVILYKKGDLDSLNKELDRRNIKDIYWIKSGENDGIQLPSKRNLVHAVFPSNDPHGDVYTYVSKWLATTYGGDDDNYVPHIVNLPITGDYLRAELGIPTDAIVFGRYGGFDQFDIPMVKKTICDFAKANPSVYFLFMNTERFSRGIKNIIYVDGTYDLNYKSNFINSCDYMIHARQLGESFGLSIAEFMSKGNSVITYKGGRDKNHLEMCSKTGEFYQSGEDLQDIFKKLSTKPPSIAEQIINSDEINKNYSPKIVMDRFVRIFKF